VRGRNSKERLSETKANNGERKLNRSKNKLKIEQAFITITPSFKVATYTTQFA